MLQLHQPRRFSRREWLLWTTNTDGPAGGSNSLLVGVWNAVNRPIQGGGKDGIPEVRGKMSSPSTSVKWWQAANYPRH